MLPYSIVVITIICIDNKYTNTPAAEHFQSPTHCFYWVWFNHHVRCIMWDHFISALLPPSGKCLLPSPVRNSCPSSCFVVLIGSLLINRLLCLEGHILFFSVVWLPVFLDYYQTLQARCMSPVGSLSVCTAVWMCSFNSSVSTAQPDGMWHLARLDLWCIHLDLGCFLLWLSVSPSLHTTNQKGSATCLLISGSNCSSLIRQGIARIRDNRLLGRKMSITAVIQA